MYKRKENDFERCNQTILIVVENSNMKILGSRLSPGKKLINIFYSDLDIFVVLDPTAQKVARK